MSTRSDFQLTSPENPERKRDWRVETQHGRTELVSKMVTLREARLAPSPEIILTARFLIFMGLPVRRTKERTIRKSARLANGETIIVTFHAADEDVDLPFGSDVNLMHFLIDSAIQAQSSFVSWETAQEYLNWMGLKKGGRTLKQLRARFERIAGMSVMIQRETGEDVEKFRMPIIRATRLPKSIKPEDPAKSAATNGPSISTKRENLPKGLAFDDAFFKNFISENVPILKAMLILLSDRPQLQQYIGFLGWRSYAASSASLIPWANLAEQVWYTDSNRSRMKQCFRDAITACRIAWPELQAEAREDGLWIAPPCKKIQFMPSLPGPERQVEPSRKAALKRLTNVRGEDSGLFSVAEIAGVA
jgi:hypothetical protein